MEIIQQLVSKEKYGIKCPHTINPKYITIHNTDNNASAQNEINYMQRNGNSTSFHIAVDDKVAIQGIPFDRNAWHAGDGANGPGNRNSIGIEICYSTDYASGRHEKAFYNAVEIVQQLMKQFNIPIENVVQHNHWSGKNCPSRIRKEGTWEKFLSLCKEESEETNMGLVNGYQSLTWVGQKIHAYKQSGKEKLGLISLPYGSVLDITKFKLPGKVIKCIVNCHYFEMGKSNGYLGRCQSFTEDALTLGPQDSNYKGWNGGKDKPYMDLVVLNDGTVKAGDFNSWDYPKNEVMIGIAPAHVEILNGKDVDIYSPAVGYGKVTTANTQTLLVKCEDGKFALVVVAGKLNLNQCRDWGHAYKVTEMSAQDSGGSSQMRVDGVNKLYTKRAIPTCLVIYEDIEEATDPEPSVPDLETNSINVDSVGLRIRESLSFKNGKPTGKVIGFIPVGAKAKLIEFVNGIQKDGYQWAKVEYQGITGYSQYDSMCYWIDDGGEE
ncbi:N-acetylmuramoyl-L-alanine amidase [Anaerorhabdus sp.]|uniref:N-acetylmuramoyl-L-alanine amidase n=1 Tax=Anaerorhabdus sp. TaxID=1872524 RepID=UPI002FC86E83